MRENKTISNQCFTAIYVVAIGKLSLQLVNDAIGLNAKVDEDFKSVKKEE